MERGWIPLWRKVEESAVFQSDPLWKLWCLLLIRATHKERKVPVRTGRGDTIITLQPGQVLFGRNSFAKALRCNPNAIPPRMEKLKNLGNCNIQPHTHFSIVTINNWDTYADLMNSTHQPLQQPNNNQTPTKQHIQSLKHYKKDQNPAAVAIYEFYSENIINVPAKRSDAIHNITKLLNNGCTKEDLAGAVEDYLEKGVGDKPFHPNNFFGQKEYYKGFGKYAK